MKTSSFSYDLPEESIAQQPSPKRGGSRLMVVNRDNRQIIHSRIDQLSTYLESGTVMVLNKTRVINARIYGTSVDSGARVEFLLLSELQPGLWRTLAAKARKQLPGKCFKFPAGIKAQIVAESDLETEQQSDRSGFPADEGFRYLRFTPPIDIDYLETHGHVPLPPYIRRKDTQLDSERYQTVYAEDPGSAAAPTAGLHLTRELLEGLGQNGVIPVKLTLHVGAGTFLPIRAEKIEEHKMHEESYHIPPETAELINSAMKEGRAILAVGTTVVRALESAYDPDRPGVAAGSRRTSLFIYPGYHFKVVSQLLTNFHTPRSSLLVLVSAFAGRERIWEAYESAVREGYRFFSYGDAMLIR
ncbi:MAG: tRNA preQ1(34) S-adenosylmethionine ribosyltransferase-isomerase QueA [Spirochaetaceae bacterium]|nr:MAG: tRNA preQ1(34) S-adenosylmethionine ribosyltransferase-isomerase QueA [Spirochaetaceae bacterium]